MCLHGRRQAIRVAGGLGPENAGGLGPENVANLLWAAAMPHTAPSDESLVVPACRAALMAADLSAQNVANLALPRHRCQRPR